jgi:hypothetical protein
MAQPPSSRGNDYYTQTIWVNPPTSTTFTLKYPSSMGRPSIELSEDGRSIRLTWNWPERDDNGDFGEAIWTTSRSLESGPISLSVSVSSGGYSGRSFWSEFRIAFAHNFMASPRSAFAATTATIATIDTMHHTWEATTAAAELIGALTPTEIVGTALYIPGPSWGVLAVPFAVEALGTAVIGGALFSVAYTYEVAFESAAEAWYTTTVDPIFIVLSNSQRGR